MAVDPDDFGGMIPLDPDDVIPVPGLPTSILGRVMGTENFPNPIPIGNALIGGTGDRAGVLPLTDSSGGSPSITLSAQTLPNELTDETGGNPQTTIDGDTPVDDVTATFVRELNLVRAQLSIMRDAVATLAAHHNDLVSHLGLRD